MHNIKTNQKQIHLESNIVIVHNKTHNMIQLQSTIFVLTLLFLNHFSDPPFSKSTPIIGVRTPNQCGRNLNFLNGTGSPEEATDSIMLVKQYMHTTTLSQQPLLVMPAQEARQLSARSADLKAVC